LLRFQSISIGTGEINSCVRCSPLEPSSYEPLDVVARRVTAACQSWRDTPGPNIVLSGPEPMKHPRLPALVDLVCRAGVRRLALRTDGRGFAIARNAEGAVASGIRQLHVVVGRIDADATSPSPETHEAMEGVRNFCEASRKQAVDSAVIGVVLACRHNLHLLPDFVGSLTMAGAVMVRIEAAAVDPDSDVTPWLESSFHTGIVHGAWVDLTDFQDQALRITGTDVAPITIDPVEA